MGYNSNRCSRKLEPFDNVQHFCTKFNNFLQKMAQPFDKVKFSNL